MNLERNLEKPIEMDSVQILTEIRAMFALWVLRALSKDLEAAFISEPSVQFGRCPNTGQIQSLLCNSLESLTYAFAKIQKLLIEKSVQHDSEGANCNEQNTCSVNSNVIKSNEANIPNIEAQFAKVSTLTDATTNSTNYDILKNNDSSDELQRIPVVAENLEIVGDGSFNNEVNNKVMTVGESGQIEVNELANKDDICITISNNPECGLETSCIHVIIENAESDTKKLSDSLLHSEDEIGFEEPIQIEPPEATPLEDNSIDKMTVQISLQPLETNINVKADDNSTVSDTLCEVSSSFLPSGSLSHKLGVRRSSRRRLVNKRYTLWVANSMPAVEEELEDGEASADDGKLRKNYEEAMPFKYFCEQCSFKTKRISHLKKHKAIHKKVKTLYSCGQCSFTSMRLGHLRRHEASHSSVLHKCDKCTYSTDDAKLLVRHYKQKHHCYKSSKDGRLLKCKECAYKTQRQHLFDRHKRIHCVHNHQCDQCPYRTWRKEHYTRHVNNVHKDKRPYLCHLCGKAFKRGDSLRHHQTIFHSSDPRSSCVFTCEVCGKTFRTQSHLEEHSAVHSTVRSFLCEICGASFKTRSVQRKHVQTIHQNPRSKSCAFCDKKFNTVFALRRHLKVHNCKEETEESAWKKKKNVSNQSGVPSTSAALLPVSSETMMPILSGGNQISILTSAQATPLEGEVLHETVLTADMIGTLHPSNVLQSTEVTSALLFLTNATIL